MPSKKNKIAIFEARKIRRIWDDKKEKWYFSVVDIVQTLIQQTDYQTARKYWNKLAERLKKEGSETVTKCHRLRLMAEDGKFARPYDRRGTGFYRARGIIHPPNRGNRTGAGI